MTKRKTHRPGGFTLAELLVSIMIIAIIASALLVAVAGARESARKSRTQAIVAKIHEFLMQRWDSYLSRPVSPRPNASVPAPLLRLLAARELVRMEMPERFTDISDGPAVLRSRPALSRRYFRQRNSNFNRSKHEQAECLYMILASMQDDSGSALDHFTASEVGDVDQNGHPELLDAWGNPIAWLRWAPGWRSPLQYGPNTNQNTVDPNYSADGLDIGKADRRWHNDDKRDDPYALFPLVVSAGPDGEFGIDDLDDPARSPVLRYRATMPFPNDPYAYPQIGRRTSGSRDDNVDSHFSMAE